MESQVTTAKQFLNRHRLATAKIRALEREINRLYETALSAPVNDGMPKGTGTSDKTGSLASKIADMREDAETLWDAQQRIRRSIERVLYQLDDAEEFEVCWERYVELKDWQEIAAEKDRAVRTIQRIHGSGLQEVQRILDEFKEGGTGQNEM